MSSHLIPDDTYLDIKSAAEFIKASPKTIRRYIQGGKVGARMVGNSWFVERASLERILMDGEIKPGRKPLKSDDPDDPDNFGHPGDSDDYPYDETDFDDHGDESCSATYSTDPLLDIDYENLTQSDILGAMLERLDSIERRLFIISAERESSFSAPAESSQSCTEEIGQLKSENSRLAAELDSARKEADHLRASAPKETAALKSKSEENESLRATIASNLRGLNLLKRELEDKTDEIHRKDAIIRDLKDRIRDMEDQISTNTRHAVLWPALKPKK